MSKLAGSFGAWLAQRRKAQDLTQEELAQRVGCSMALIRKIEANERKPSKQIVELLADVLGISAAQRDQFRHFARTEDGDVDPHQFAQVKHQHSNLVAQPNALVGREWEIAAIERRLLRDDARLITLVGPPGIGKTRLSIEVAQALHKEFPDGVYFVSLAPINDAGLVAITLAQTLGIVLTTAPIHIVLKQALRDKQLLLVLDNFEQVLPAASFVAELLAECVWVKSIVTSREPLQVRIERQFAVHALALPAHLGKPSELTDLNTLSKYASIALFVERAQAVDASFALTAHNAPSVCAICIRLEGVPLAIELAASWVNQLACDEIANEIQRNLDFLTATMQDVPERHRSLRAAFDHSWQLLTPQERDVLSRVSVFRGGFDREAAEHVAGATLVVLASLVTQSLLRRNQSSRYDLHEFVRQYAAERLSETLGEFDRETFRAHAMYFFDLALSAESELTGSHQVLWMDRLEMEHDNLRAALTWARNHDEGEVGMRMAASLKVFWASRDHIHEGRMRSMEQLALRSAQIKTAVRGHALNQAGSLAYEDSDYATAKELFDEALIIGEALQDKTLMIETLHASTSVAILQANYAKARAECEKALALAKEVGNPQAEVGILIGLGDVLRFQGHDLQARTRYEEGIRIVRVLDGKNLLGYALRQHSKVSLHLGDLQEATALCQESLMLNQQTGSKQGILACIASMAAILIARGTSVRAAQLLSAVASLLNQIAAPLLPSDRMDYDQHVAALRAQLGETAFAAAWTEGQAMTLEQAIAHALAEDV